MEVDTHLTTTSRSGWVVVTVGGDLDLASAPSVRRTLRSVVEGDRPSVVIDLDAAGVVDSVGLGLLVGCLRRAHESGGEVVLACGQARLLDLLALSRLDRVFRIVADVDEVVA